MGDTATKALHRLSGTDAAVRHHVADVERTVRRAIGDERYGRVDASRCEWQEGLAALIADLESDPPSRLGWLGVRSLLARDLVRSGEVDEAIGHEPHIAGEVIDAPVVILGLPRTGSTLLHHLLAANPELSTLYSWMMSSFLRAGAPSPVSDFRKWIRARALFVASDIAQPRFGQLHPHGADLPEECSLILGQGTYRSWNFVPLTSSGGYGDWLQAGSIRTSYDHHRRALQCLQYDRPRRQWLLKAPAHLLAVDALEATYPDARVVWLHRDPAEVMASWCELVAAIQSIVRPRVDLATIGSNWLRWWSEGMARALEWRASTSVQILDVPYSDVAERPLETAMRVWEWLGVAADDRARARAAEAADRLARSGGARLVLADLGLSSGGVREAFEAYVEAATSAGWFTGAGERTA